MRVSSLQQDLTAQFNQLNDKGVKSPLRKRDLVGTKTGEKKFNTSSKKSKEDDTIIVTKLDRFSRNTHNAYTEREFHQDIKHLWQIPMSFSR
ncbi:recombinase family protein [Priestia megaterium]|uniref:recombinase family protein n=1 Tax=Priestia megaterium TaxID=1404 RepID=UPI00399CD09D